MSFRRLTVIFQNSTKYALTAIPDTTDWLPQKIAANKSSKPVKKTSSWLEINIVFNYKIEKTKYVFSGWASIAALTNKVECTVSPKGRFKALHNHVKSTSNHVTLTYTLVDAR